jgi:uncharacterized damage-inducible protein DinB
MPPSFDALRHLSSRLARTFDGPMWHGPSLREVLDEVPAAMAHRSDVPGAHSIWALVLHMTEWASIAQARLDGERLEYPPMDVDWRSVPPTATEPAWRAAVMQLGEAYHQLSARTAAMDAGTLLDRVAGQDYSLATMLDGVVEHGTYHGGQVAMLRRIHEARGR